MQVSLLQGGAEAEGNPPVPKMLWAGKSPLCLQRARQGCHLEAARPDDEVVGNH